MNDAYDPSQTDALIPYSADRLWHCERALVLAPHPDDEIFCCGGTIAYLLATARNVWVEIVTDGAVDGAVKDGESLVNKRIGESKLAARRIGLPSSRLRFWNLADRSLVCGPVLIDRISNLFRELQPDVVFTPSLVEVHPDHRAIALATYLASRAFRSARPELLMFEISQTLQPNTLIDITPYRTVKRRAMESFTSQLAERDYIRVVEGLNSYRSYTLPVGMNAAEAFYRLRPKTDPLPAAMQEVLDQHLSRPGGALPAGCPPEPIESDPSGSKQGPWSGPLGSADQPAVAIVIRTRWRESLEQAVDSLDRQSHRPLLIVLVDAGRMEEDPAAEARRLARCARIGDGLRMASLRIVGSGEPLDRSTAANLGLEAALASDAELIGFLDDDDLLEPNHISDLAGLLEAGPHQQDPPVAAYSWTRLLSPKGHSQTILRPDHDPARLLRANYLPIHSVLLRRQALEGAIRFDPRFDLYEDWDFWIQLSRTGRFVGSRAVTAIYQQHMESIASDRTPEALELHRIARRSIYEKWLPMLSLDEVERGFAMAVMDLAQAEQVRQSNRGWRGLLRKARRRLKRMIGALLWVARRPERNR